MDTINYGVFMRANYQDGLKLGHIAEGLVGCVFIKEVPDSYTEADIETLVVCQGLGYKFGQNLHENVVLSEKSFPSICRFSVEIGFPALVRGAVQELTKQRKARQAA